MTDDRLQIIGEIVQRYEKDAERRKVRAFLLRVLLDLPWESVGARIHRSAKQASQLASQGRQMLVEAAEVEGWLDPSDLDELLRARV